MIDLTHLPTIVTLMLSSWGMGIVLGWKLQAIVNFFKQST